MQPPGASATDIVLLGAGMAHLEVLRRFALRRQHRVRLTLVTPEPETPCAGLLPALVRGDCSIYEACIDLGLLAMAAGARLILADAVGLDLEGRTLELAGRPALPFDLLSVDLSGESAMPDVRDACIPVIPPGGFLARLPALEDALPDGARLAIIGSDPAAVELALALARRFRGRLRLVLVSEMSEPLAAAPLRTRRAVRAALVDAGVELASAVRAGALTEGRLALSDGSFLSADVALWASRTVAPAFLAESGLACDAEGRVLVGVGQRSVSHPGVFAAGDCATRPPDRPSGPLLPANLRRAARGRKPTRFLRWGWLPRVALSTLDLGGGRAVAWCNGLALSGEAVSRGKDWLDQRRMRRYALPIAPSHPALWRASSSDAAWWHAGSWHHAAGVGVGSAQPAATLAARPLMPAPDALIGLGTPGRTAVLTPPAGHALVQSVTCLRSCFDDPFVFGQIAAAHALSELHAMGAQPWTALAIVTAIPGATIQAESEAMLAGASDTLAADGCTLVGTRRMAGSEASLGLVLSGLGDPARLLRKSGLRPGDALLLTKPLGTGIVLTAHERGAARGRWLRAAIDAMRTSNAVAARVLREHGATACASVAERGLANHLKDMLCAARAAAVLWPELVPALPGVLELVAAGVTAPGALRYAQALPDPGADPRTALLADPQLSGGLLAVVPPARAGACLAALRGVGLRAAIVGVVEAAAPDAPVIRLEAGQGIGPDGGPAAAYGAAPAQLEHLPS
jgi:selenide, water dikinase